MKNELQAVISGKIKIRHGEAILAALSYLARSSRSSSMAKEVKHYKIQETKRLRAYINSNKLWIDNLDLSKFISEGAEQKVYLVDGNYVLKLNDTIFYNSWLDYLHNLLLHNYFFEDTAYSLEGFYENETIVFAVVKQPFVLATSKTDLNSVKDFMMQNGFQNNRNNDYINPQMGVIIEDLHDENVLTQDGLLQFIDTVIYLTSDFYELK